MRRLLPLLFYAGLTIVMTYPTVMHMSSRMPIRASDHPLFTCWRMDHNISRILTLNAASFHDSNIFFPHTATASYDDPLISTSALGIPFYLLFRGNIVLTYNAVFLLSLFLAAWGTHLFIQKLTGNTVAAAIGAIILAFAPFKIRQAESVSVFTTLWIPFVFLCLCKFTESKTWKHAASFFCFLVLSGLATPSHILAIVSCAAVSALIIIVASKPDRFKFLRRLMIAFVLAAGALFIMCRPHFFHNAAGLLIPPQFDVLILLGCAVLCGYIIAWLMSRIGQRWKPLFFVIPLSIAFGYVLFPIKSAALPNNGVTPPVYGWLATMGEDTAILEVPVNYPWRNIQYLYYSIFHHKNMVNGYSSYSPLVFNYFNCPPAEELSDERLNALRYLGVTHLVVHSDIMSDKDKAAFRARLPECVPSPLKFVKTFDVTEIYEINDAAPRFQSPSSLAGIPDAIRLHVADGVPPETSCTAAVEFIGSTPEIALSGMVIPNCRRLELSFINDRDTVVHTQSSRLEDIAGHPFKYSAFPFKAPKKEGKYIIRVANRGQVIAETGIEVNRDRKTTVSPGILQAEIKTDETTLVSGANQTVKITVRLRNHGDTVWLARSPGGKAKGEQKVQIGYRIFLDGKQIKEGRAPLPFDVAPGQRANVPLVFRSPAECGIYSIKLDLVIEHVTWFEDKGSEPRTLQLNVTPPTVNAGK